MSDEEDIYATMDSRLTIYANVSSSGQEEIPVPLDPFGDLNYNIPTGIPFSTIDPGFVTSEEDNKYDTVQIKLQLPTDKSVSTKRQNFKGTGRRRLWCWYSLSCMMMLVVVAVLCFCIFWFTCHPALKCAEHCCPLGWIPANDNRICLKVIYNTTCDFSVAAQICSKYSSFHLQCQYDNGNISQYIPGKTWRGQHSSNGCYYADTDGSIFESQCSSPNCSSISLYPVCIQTGCFKDGTFGLDAKYYINSD